MGNQNQNSWIAQTIYERGILMTIQTTTGPNGEPMVLLSAERYQDLVDARGQTGAMPAIASGAIQTLSEAESAACLAARTPLAFWRRHRGMTQQALANAVGVSQAYIAQIENGARKGRPIMFRDIARELRVRMEDLLA
jgi:DNA-binding XRE family transcriptional regulator